MTPTDFLVIPATRTQVAVIRWLIRAISKINSRPVLNGILFAENEWVALSSASIHVASELGPLLKTNADWWPTDGLYGLRGIVEGHLVILEKMGGVGEYPNYKIVIENALKGGLYAEEVSPAYIASFAVSPSIMTAAMSYTGNVNSKPATKFEIRGGPLILKIGCEDEFKLTAYVMPMYFTEATPYYIPERKHKQTALLKPEKEIHVER